MHKRFSTIFLLSLGLYSVTSWLLMLKDYLIIERISRTLQNPAFETQAKWLGALLKVDYSTTLLFALALAGLFYGYWGIIESASKSLAKIPVKLILVAVTITFVSFPVLSTDVFDYNNNNRIFLLHRESPWIHSADDFKDDEIYYGSWITRPTIYPTVSMTLSLLVGLVWGLNPLVAVVGFKLLAGVSYSFVLWLIHKFIHQKNRNWWLVWFGLNPLILIEFIGNAHNDLWVGVFSLAAFITFSFGQPIATGLNLGLGFLSKFTNLLYLPWIALGYFQKKQSLSLLQILAVFFGVSTVGMLMMGSSLPYYSQNLATQFEIYYRSLTVIVRGFAEASGADSQQAITVFKYVFIYPALIAVGLREIWVNLKKPQPVESSIRFMLAYIIIGSAMLQPWYLAWVIPVMVLSKSKRLLVTVSIFSCSLLLSYLTYYISLYRLPLSHWWQLIIYLVMTGPALVTLLAPQQWYTRLKSLLLR